MAKSGKGDSKGRGENSGQGANMEADGKPQSGFLLPNGDYDRPAVMSTVCTLMAEGQSLRRICAAVEGMPKHSTVCSWMLDDADLADQYARARTLLADYRFDELRDKAADVVAQYIREGWEPKDAVAMAKLETGNMQWELSKLAPKRYGDKIIQENTGPDGGPQEHLVAAASTPEEFTEFRALFTKHE